MKTAILVFIVIMAAMAIYSVGICVGAWKMGKRIADATVRALKDSDLTNEQKLDILHKIEKEVKK